MIITVIAFLIGLLLLGCGLFYLFKEKDDNESRKIYIITALIGAVIVIGAAIKLFV